MTRGWNDLVAWLADGTPGGVVGLAVALLLVAAVAALLWYTWPPRLPGSGHLRGAGVRADRRSGGRRWRWPAWRWRPRWPRWLLRWLRRRRRGEPPSLDELAPDDLPDLPAQALALTADELAAAGRYAEAVRERLRAIVRALIEQGVIEHRVGWTVTELASAGARARPETAAPLRGAAEVFSQIWYGLRPARLDDDLRMRRYADDVRDALRRPPAGVAR